MVLAIVDEELETEAQNEHKRCQLLCWYGSTVAGAQGTRYSPYKVGQDGAAPCVCADWGVVLERLREVGEGDKEGTWSMTSAHEVSCEKDGEES